MSLGLRPTILTIFGITGNLAERKLLPALYSLKAQDLLPKDLYIVGFSRRDWTHEFLREHLADIIKKNVKDYDSKILGQILDGVYYVCGDFGKSEDYARLGDFLASLEKDRRGHINKIFYLATQPEYYPEIFSQLGNCGLAHCTPEEQSNILIEKPFGYDEKSAKHLTKLLLKHFREDQIYRIDHYLGKDPVQNILSFRFANSVFEHLWSSKHIDNIQISAAMEDIGIENRGAFYERTGALLDVVQNHVLQLLALVCMEQPYSMDPEDIRSRKQELLTKVSINTSAEYVCKGQYTAGIAGGKQVVAYRQEEKVASDSQTETFVALKLKVSNDRWRGVPIYIRTGKRLSRRFTEISVEFKQSNIHFLENPNHKLTANVLTIRIHPEESISLRLTVKKPEFAMALEPVQMDFCYEAKFKYRGPDAYQRIIYEAFFGSHMLFVRSDSVIQQWKIIDRVKKRWQKYALEFYEAGTSGPKGQNSVVQKDGRNWWSDSIEECSFHKNSGKSAGA